MTEEMFGEQDHGDEATRNRAVGVNTVRVSNHSSYRLEIDVRNLGQSRCLSTTLLAPLLKQQWLDAAGALAN